METRKNRPTRSGRAPNFFDSDLIIQKRFGRVSSLPYPMVPVNTHYEEVFDRSTIAMRITDEDGRTRLKSAGASELSAEMFSLLKRQAAVRTPEGQELHIHAVRGGYAVWQNDVSRTVAAIDELHKTAERMEHEGELLRQELKVRSDETAVKEQNRIYNQLTDEIGGAAFAVAGYAGKAGMGEGQRRVVQENLSGWDICQKKVQPPAYRAD